MTETSFADICPIPVVIVLYEFRDRLPTLKRVRRVIVQGSRNDVERFIPLAEFGRLFGGFLLWHSSDDSSDPDEAVGVWGTRTIRLFKRALRQRGAVYRCVRDVEPGGELVALHVDPAVNPARQPVPNAADEGVAATRW